MNNRKLAEAVAVAEAYAGGYLYPGTKVSYTRPDKKNHLLAPLDQLVHFVKAHDCRKPQPRIAHNKRILTQLPVGSEVCFNYSNIDTAGEELFKKTGPCKWALAYSWEDNNES